MKGRWGVLIACLGVVACHDPIRPDPSDADPGFVSVSLATSKANVGALRFRVRGAGIDSVQSTFLLFEASNMSDERQAIVVGTVSSGTVLRVWVPDRNDVNSYEIEVIEAASIGSYVQMDPTAFTVALTPESD